MVSVPGFVVAVLGFVVFALGVGAGACCGSALYRPALQVRGSALKLAVILCVRGDSRPSQAFRY